MRIAVPALLWLAAKFALLLAGLLLPGAALMRVLRVPRTIATCFAGSLLSLYATVLTLQLASIRISLGSLAATLVVIAATALVLGRDARPARRSEPASSPDGRAGRPALPGSTWFTRMGAWAPVYALFWAAVLWRAWH